MRRRIPWLLAMSACTSADHSFLQLPERGPDLRSLILVLEGPGRLEVLATDSESAVLEVERSGLERITLFGYAASLAELEVAPGYPALAPRDACGHRRVPEADVSWVADLGQAQSIFVQGAQISARVDEVRLRVDCPCVRFLKIGEASLGTVSNVFSILPFDDERVVVRADKSYIIDGNAQIVDTSVGPGLALLSGYRSADGVLWYGTSTSTLARGAWNALEHVPLGARLDTRWIAGPHLADAPFELFILGIDSAFSRFDGTERRVIWPPNVARSMQAGGVVWLSPGEAIASPESGKDLLWYQGGSTARVEPWSEETGEIAGMGYVGPPYGVVVGTQLGRVASGRPGQWQELEQRTPADLDAALNGFVAFRGGMIGVGDASSIVQHHPYSDFCPVQRFNTGIDLHQVVVLGDRIFIAGRPNTDGSDTPATSTVLVLTPER